MKKQSKTIKITSPQSSHDPTTVVKFKATEAQPERV